MFGFPPNTGSNPVRLWTTIIALTAFVLAPAVPAAAQEEPLDIVALRLLYSGQPLQWPRPILQPDAVFTEFGPTPQLIHAPDNPSTSEKITFGRMLFNDPRLSGSGQIACASCHNRELGFGDGISTSFGHDRQRGRRNALPLYAVPWMRMLFWDGRASSLEEQALASITNPLEMAADPEVAVSKIAADELYTAVFSRAFGDQTMAPEHIAQALAAFLRTHKPRYSKWDRVMRDGTKVLNDQELLGLHLFRSKAGCANCHNGPLFTDQRFHNIGLSYYGRRLQDLGRYEITHNAADVGAFRTPSLRGISRTAPYMHNGVFPHLRGIVNFYNAGGVQLRRRPEQADDPLFPTTSLILKPLKLTKEEREALIAFLETL